MRELVIYHIRHRSNSFTIATPYGWWNCRLNNERFPEEDMVFCWTHEAYYGWGCNGTIPKDRELILCREGGMHDRLLQ